MKYSLHIIFVILFLSCEENSVEDLLADFSVGNTPITTLNPLNSTYNSSDVSISWTGNGDATSFRYRLEPKSYIDTVKTYTGWSEWEAVYTVTFINLDEGNYNFYIKSRSTIENEETPDSVHFIVDAIDGPAIRMYPLYQQVSVGENFDMYMYIEDVADFVGGEFHLSYDASKLLANSMSAGTVLLNSLLFYDTINSTTGTIELVSTVNNHPGYTGSDVLAKINFTAGPSASLDTLHIETTSNIRNSGNVPIDILNRMYGIIEVVE